MGEQCKRMSEMQTALATGLTQEESDDQSSPQVGRHGRVPRLGCGSLGLHGCLSASASRPCLAVRPTPGSFFGGNSQLPSAMTL